MYIGIYLENAAHKALLLASYLFSEDFFFECHVRKFWKDIPTESIEFTDIFWKLITCTKENLFV